MNKKSDDFAPDIELLLEVEFGDRLEPYLRVFAVFLSGLLIYIYTDWIGALLWPAGFLAALLIHKGFISTRKAPVSKGEVVIASSLFAILQASFGWLPLTLFSGTERVLVLVGAALFGAQLLFLIRRSDTLTAYNVAQVIMLLVGSIAIYIAFLPSYDTTLAYIGAALALLGLNFYFLQTMRVSRRMRLSREAAAQEAHQAQKMAAIGLLAGGVAHDFNNNLTAIIGSLELSQAIQDPKETKVDVDNALVAARQAASTIKNLMIFARVEKPNLAIVGLCDLVAELRTLITRLIPTSVTLNTMIEDPKLAFRADRNQLLSGLINIVVNSVDAMPKGGSLMITAQRKHFETPELMTDGRSLPPGTYVQLSLADTGHGIPEDILPQVVDPFFTTKPVGKGTGLGLSMVAGMMQEFDGGLSLRSSPQGTKINLLFPAQKPTARQTAPPPRPRASH